LGKKNLVSKARNAKKYVDIYDKGAVYAFLLDIKIRELTGREESLLSVIKSLMQRYGTEKPFPEATFIDVVIETAHPDLRQFFDDYIIGSVAPNYQRAFSKLGWIYLPKGSNYATYCYGTRFGFNPSTNSYNIAVAGANTLGLRVGDQLLTVDGNPEIDADVLMKLLYPVTAETAVVKVKRQGIELLLTSERQLIKKQNGAMILLNQNATTTELTFRESLLGN